MIKVVIDTNVLVSAALTSYGNPAKILNLISVNTEIQVYYCPDIINEYREVLSRPRLNINAEKQTRAINAIMRTGIRVDPIASNIPLPDESDRIFYDTTCESNAILITGNIKHYPAEDFIMTPRRFLDMLNSDESG
ncbi:MAG: putative toxin-antitoxin system toxin component, PIN family [Clostridiales bacterium]|jgi:putative PIN family toxin of toxin-antitoxin system|nr:putative toxin-antitoxin system toxin component, PIN family [Clostridiales bacterium]